MSSCQQIFEMFAASVHKCTFSVYETEHGTKKGKLMIKYSNKDTEVHECLFDNDMQVKNLANGVTNMLLESKINITGIKNNNESNLINYKKIFIVKLRIPNM